MMQSSLPVLLAAVILGAGVFSAPAPAKALTKEQIIQRCAESIKEEFGEAEFEFKNIRRSSEREWAFGELEMSDGSKRPIRCQIFNRRKVDVKFRGSGDGSDGVSPWTSDRPANAGFIKKEDPEKPAEPEAQQQEDQTAAKEAERKPQRRTVGGEQTNEQTGAGQGDQTSDAPASSDQKQTAGAAPSGDDQSGEAQAAETQSGDDAQPKEEERSGPIFRRVETQ